MSPTSAHCALWVTSWWALLPRTWTLEMEDHPPLPQLAPFHLGAHVRGLGTALVWNLPYPFCSYWLTHYQGASCSDGNDCSDELVCKSGKCASSWLGSIRIVHQHILSKRINCLWIHQETSRRAVYLATNSFPHVAEESNGSFNLSNYFPQFHQ